MSESGGATSLDAGAGGSPVCGCPGACLADGGCAECVLHADCTDSGRTRCEPSTHTCVECLPGAEDTCTVGRYCGDSFVCVPGCKAGGAECASGVCTVDHDCAPCLGDTECGGQRACGSGACGSRCAAPGDCSGGATCCDTRCVSTGTDHRNCGGCGVACSPAQYCAPAGCRAAVVANLCDVGRVTFLTDGLGVDDIASGQAQAALTTACPAVTVRAVAASGTGLINPTTGQPVVGGGETLVTLGGPFGQYLLRYLEGGGISPVYSYEMPFGTFYGRAVADGGADPAIVGVSPSELTDTHDFFVAQMIRDPLSGTLTFSVYGMNVAGTRAATWFLANRVLADLASFDRAYYVYEWTDGDGNATAGAADTFTLVRSGP